jgi:hypothetical protein
MADEKKAEGSCLPCNKDTRTKDWYAWLNLMPPTPDELYVTGEVYVSNPGVDPLLVFKEPQGINPRILLLDLILCQKPGIWPPVLVWKKACYEKVGRTLRYDTVQIFCGSDTIATIPVEDIH